MKRLVGVLVLVLCCALPLIAEGGGEAAAAKPITVPTTGTPMQKFDAISKQLPKILQIEMLGWVQEGTVTPQEDVLTPIWREKTKVIPRIITIPDARVGGAPARWVQMRIVADTLPQILTTNGVLQNLEVLDGLLQAKKLYEIKLEDIKKYMPLTVAYFQKLGINVDDWYKANTYRGSVEYARGKLWYMPAGGPGGNPNALASPVLNEHISQADNVGNTPYSLYFRDDILKKIFPQVRTEAELKALYLQKGKLDIEDVYDIPIKTTDDLLNYCRKVKALNLTQSGRPIYAAHPNREPGVDSLRWSVGCSMAGNGMAHYGWSGIGEYHHYGDKLNHLFTTPQWKEFIRWFNTAYNEGLLDPECFVQKMDQMNAKVVNGEYAIINWWHDVNAARKVSNDEKRGYGYRILYLFNPRTEKDFDTGFTDLRISNTYTLKSDYDPVGITTKVKPEDFVQILHWLDWNYSEAALDLRTWGLPEWSTGTGANRRFKPEFKDLENWAIKGATGGKDGWYYGLWLNGYGNLDIRDKWNHETSGVGHRFYEDSPKWVYPPAPEDNMDVVCNRVQRIYTEKFSVHIKMDPEIATVWQDAEYLKIKNITGWRSTEGKDIVLQAIVGKPADFDATYAKYLKLYEDERWKAAYAKMQVKFKQVWETSGMKDEAYAKLKAKNLPIRY